MCVCVCVFVCVCVCVCVCACHLHIFKVSGKVSRARRMEVIQTCMKLHSDDCHDLYPSPDINEMIETRKIRWVGYDACTGKGRNA
jgi:hypothetical protein